MRTLVVGVFAVLAFLSIPLGAGDDEAFSYYGWVEQDRWGDLWFSNGGVSARAAPGAVSLLRPFVGKPVEVRTVGALLSFGVGDMTLHAPLSVGAPERIRKQPSLWLMVGHNSLPAATAAFIQLTVAFSGPEEFYFKQTDVRLHLRRKGPVREEGGDPVAQSIDGLDWRSAGVSSTFSEDGVEDTIWRFNAPGPGLMTGRGELKLGFELAVRAPTGAYEVWATFGDANLSRDPAPRTRRFPFDVKGVPVPR